MTATGNKFYITTPIYYVNSRPHIGTSYTTILADVVARSRRFQGQDARLVTGSDEHSQNIADLAAAAGKTPLAFCDEIVPVFHQLWRDIAIQDYRFERTSSEDHRRVVQAFWQRIFDQGDVYQGSYSGWYHTTDNRFLDEDEVPEHPEKDPRLKFLTEEAYFFRLSKYQDWLLEFHAAQPEFVVPSFRRTEMLNRITAGLRDICISRTSTDWGIPLPWDGHHVFYVWIEALLTYLTASGFDLDAFLATIGPDGRSREVREPLWETTRADLRTQPAGNYWPCDLHLMAKDIPWFHAVIWPAMLASFGAPPPKQMLVHGYWNFDGEKMSKSLGNVVDPYDAIKLVGVDGLRYFLLREVPVGLDGNFSHEALLGRFNYDLANDLGNLVHRTVSMLHQLFEGVVPEVLAVSELDEQIEARRQELPAEVLEHFAQLRFNEGLQAIWSLVGAANKYIDEKKPWELKKKPERRDEISTVFNRLVNVIRTVLLLAYPVIPGGVARFWEILGLNGAIEDQRIAALASSIPAGHCVNASTPVYQRVDLKTLAVEPPAGPPPPAVAQPAAAKAEPPGAAGEVISIDTFGQVALRVAAVKTAERVEGTEKLLKLTVFDGERERQIVAGIAQHYTPEEMVGKRIVIVANLAPAKLRRILSEGMLLAATDAEGRLSVVSPEREVDPGAKVR